MRIGFKELFLLFCVRPDSGSLVRSTSINTYIFFASILELIAHDQLTIEDDRWYVSEKFADDPVLEKVRSILFSRNEKKTNWVLAGTPVKIGGLLSLLREHMLKKRLISCVEKRFWFWKTGYRYRVLNPKIIRHETLRIEKVLIYGRSPDAETLAMILLLGYAGLHSRLFSDGEFRKKASVGFRSLRNEPRADIPEAYYIVGQELRKALMRKKVNAAK